MKRVHQRGAASQEEGWQSVVTQNSPSYGNWNREGVILQRGRMKKSEKQIEIIKFFILELTASSYQVSFNNLFIFDILEMFHYFIFL